MVLLLSFSVESSGKIVVELDVIVRQVSLSMHIVVVHFPLMHNVEVELVRPSAYCSCCMVPITYNKTIEHDNKYTALDISINYRVSLINTFRMIDHCACSSWRPRVHIC
jgi:hypothetical protein